MHELPITEQIINLATQHGLKAGAARIVCIKLVVGESSGYIGDSIQMYFDVISKGTLCEGASLEIIPVKPKLRCPAGGELFERRPMRFDCPVCGADGEPTDIGREFFIDSIEVA
jgi:hydrogenase nickel incorporation protein HypA/HybF